MKYESENRGAYMIRKSRKIFFAGIGGILTAFCYVAGYSLDNFDSLNLTDMGFYGKWMGAGLGIALLLYGVWNLADRVRKRERRESRIKEINPKAAYAVSVIFLFLCWLPALLSIFPGAFSYDAYEEWRQVHEGMLTSHHPVLHVLLLGGLTEGFHDLTGSYNVGIAVYSVLQMLLTANVFAVTLVFLKKFSVPLWLRGAALLFYAFSPVIQLFSICATKDVPFTAAQLLFFLYVIYFYTDREKMLSSKRHLAGFACTALLAMIFRNNGLYIVLITLGLMVISVLRSFLTKNGKRNLLRFGCTLAAILAVYGLYTGPFYQILNVTGGGVEEMLSVPLQQMARVYRYDSASLEEEDVALLYTFVPRENLEQYHATVSDFVKKDFNREAFEQNKAGFVKLWIKWGAEHPLTYINSFLINTVDFWYPNAVVDGYRDVYGKSSFFDYQVDKPGTERVLLPGLHGYYEAISHDSDVQKLPFAFLALSPGWYFVMFLVIFLYLLRSRVKSFYVPMMIFVLTMLTVLAGPMALVRYVLIFYYGFPVLLAIFLYGNRFERGESSHG